jgi:hypothetical protein
VADEIKVTMRLPDFKRQLDEFSKIFQDRIVRYAVAGAGGVFKRAAIALAPVLHSPSKRRQAGVLKRSIYLAFNRARSRKGIVVAYVLSFKKRRQSGGDPFYGRFLEAGWLPRGPGKRIAGGTKRKALERTRLKAGGHRFIDKFRFLQPAFRQNQTEALNVFSKRMEQRIAQATNRTGVFR